MKKLLLATTALIALSGAARADFVFIGGDTAAGKIAGDALEKADLSFKESNEKGGTTSSGAVSDGDIVSIASTKATGTPGVFTATGETFDTASGNATITPVKGVDLNTITFTPDISKFHFTSFTTRGQLQSVAGNVTIVVDDNFNHEFTFSEPKSSDWSPIGVEAIFGSGEFITSITISTDDKFGFSELKQQTFGFEQSVTGAVPEASTWAMMLLGFVGVGTMGLRRRRQFRFV